MTDEEKKTFQNALMSAANMSGGMILASWPNENGTFGHLMAKGDLAIEDRPGRMLGLMVGVVVEFVVMNFGCTHETAWSLVRELADADDGEATIRIVGIE